VGPGKRWHSSKNVETRKGKTDGEGKRPAKHRLAARGFSPSQKTADEKVRGVMYEPPTPEKEKTHGRKKGRRNDVNAPKSLNRHKKRGEIERGVGTFSSYAKKKPRAKWFHRPQGFRTYDATSEKKLGIRAGGTEGCAALSKGRRPIEVGQNLFPRFTDAIAPRSRHGWVKKKDSTKTPKKTGRGVEGRWVLEREPFTSWGKVCKIGTRGEDGERGGVGVRRNLLQQSRGQNR